MSPETKKIAEGRRVVALEAAALTALAESLDRDFADVVDAILACKGRVVVSGMGKSGHIARKIAATLASTGTPAHFVHPAEASHGDLGMIDKDDIVLLLSNSGETPELADLIAYTRRRGILLIGVASKPHSTLMQRADLRIVLPDAPEACRNGLAPTTSTTLTLALGDALAVTLMELRAFTPENFRDYHPGGKLGARLALVSELMHGADELPLVGEAEPMSEALLIISSRGFGVAGVVDDAGGLVGIITDGDLRRNMDNLLGRSAGDVMTRNPRTVAPQALAAEALAEMNARKITTLFVLGPGNRKPVGILHIHDCLRAGVG